MVRFLYTKKRFHEIIRAMEKQRVYFVIDARSFYASVECVDRNLDPMTTKLVVADATRTDKTICLAVSPALKALGVKNRCRLFQVPKEYDFIVAKPRMKRYVEVAASIYKIYLQYLSKEDMHVYSIDEIILDVTDYLSLYKIRAKAFAIQLMDEVKKKLGIPMTCGIGTNMYLAKVASGITAKHSNDGIGWLDEEKFIKTLQNHTPLTDFWQISRGISARLEKLGIFDMEGIAKTNEDLLYKEFGVNAELIIDHARGKEPVTMKDIKSYKGQTHSFSSGQILPNGYSHKDAKLVIKEMTDSLCLEMARQGLVSNTAAVDINYDDDTHDRVHFLVRIGSMTNLSSYFMTPIAEAFDRKVDWTRKIRRINLGFMDVCNEDYEQYDLFSDMDEVDKEKSVRDVLLQIHEMYGKNAVLRGMDFKSAATRRERNTMIGGHAGGEDDA